MNLISLCLVTYQGHFMIIWNKFLKYSSFKWHSKKF